MTLPVSLTFLRQALLRQHQMCGLRLSKVRLRRTAILF